MGRNGSTAAAGGERSLAVSPSPVPARCPPCPGGIRRCLFAGMAVLRRVKSQVGFVAWDGEEGETQ